MDMMDKLKECFDYMIYGARYEEPVYKQIIDGELFDTSKAELVYVIPENYELADMVGDKIYRGAKGYFIMRYWNPDGGLPVRFSKISDKVVKEIIGKYDAEKYIELFGDVESV